MATAVDIGAMIVRTPGYAGSKPRIDGSSIAVTTIAFLVESGATPEAVASEHYPQLTIAQVYAAMAYYHANREELDTEEAEEARLYNELAAEARRQGQGTVGP